MRQLSNHEVLAVSGGATNSPILSLLALPFKALIFTAFIKADGSSLSYFDVLKQGFESIFPKI